MDRRKFNKYLAEWDEGPKLDFKQEFVNDAKLIKIIAAIANSTGGKGYILFGVTDDKKVIGVDPVQAKEFEETINQSVEHNIEPIPEIRFHIIKYDERRIVAALTILKNQGCLYQLNSGSYPIRRGSTTSTMRTAEIVSKFQMYGMHDYECSAVPQATLNDLNVQFVKKYINIIEPEITNPSERTLERFGIICKPSGSCIYRPTNWGMLLFGKHPQRFLPHAHIKFMNNGKRSYVYGNIPEQLTRVSAYFKAIMPSDYPHAAFYRAIENAVVHRDYTYMKQGINIMVERERVTITSPGTPLDKDCDYDIAKDNLYIHRNPKIYNELNVFLSGKQEPDEREQGVLEIMSAFSSAKFINHGGYKNKERVFEQILS